MSNEAINEYLNSIRAIYKKAKGREKTVILDGGVLATGLSRKQLRQHGATQKQSLDSVTKAK